MPLRKIRLQSDIVRFHTHKPFIKRRVGRALGVDHQNGRIVITDFILVIFVADMASYEVLTRRLFFANSNVRKFRTFVAMNRVKTGTLVSLA